MAVFSEGLAAGRAAERLILPGNFLDVEGIDFQERF